jgi:hypothetical protein
MKAVEHERQDWIIVLIILMIGFLCVLVAGQLALRFSPRWTLNTDMDSHLDPNSAFLTRRPNGFIEPVDPSILTQPGWIDVFLTPGASFVTGTPFPVMTRTSSPALATVSSVTNTAVATTSPTSTFIYFPPTRTATSKPASTVTSVSTQVLTSPVSPSPTFTLTSTSIALATSTSTVTHTAIASQTATATPTSTIAPTPIATDPTPGTIGTTPDGVPYYLPAGGTLTLGINLVANGDSNFDLVYYEFPAASGILLDWVIIEISDGTNWYTIFNWGNNIADANTNVDFNILSNPQIPPEPDQREIPSAELYNSTGIAIDVDAIVPAGTYSYIRFTAPTGDVDGQTEIDAIEFLP